MDQANDDEDKVSPENSPNKDPRKGEHKPSVESFAPNWVREIWLRLLNLQNLVVESYKLTYKSFRNDNQDCFSPIMPYFISTYNTAVHDVCYPQQPEKTMLFDEIVLRFWYVNRDEALIPFEILAPKLPSKSYINPLFKLILEDEQVM